MGEDLHEGGSSSLLPLLPLLPLHPPLPPPLLQLLALLLPLLLPFLPLLLAAGSARPGSDQEAEAALRAFQESASNVQSDNDEGYGDLIKKQAETA